jgi:hypothetical protein
MYIFPPGVGSGRSTIVSRIGRFYRTAPAHFIATYSHSPFPKVSGMLMYGRGLPGYPDIFKNDEQKLPTARREPQFIFLGVLFLRRFACFVSNIG